MLKVLKSKMPQFKSTGKQWSILTEEDDKGYKIVKNSKVSYDNINNCLCNH